MSLRLYGRRLYECISDFRARVYNRLHVYKEENVTELAVAQDIYQDIQARSARVRPIRAVRGRTNDSRLGRRYTWAHRAARPPHDRRIVEHL